MIQLQPGQRLFISKDLMGYADKLDADGVFPKRLDLLLYGFAYAIKHDLAPAQEARPQELVRVMYLGDNQLPFTAVAQWYARKIGVSISDEKELLDFLCRVGISGVEALRERWETRRKSQIQLDIARTAHSA
jgi:hypothetical protein